MTLTARRPIPAPQPNPHLGLAQRTHLMRATRNGQATSLVGWPDGVDDEIARRHANDSRMRFAARYDDGVRLVIVRRRENAS